MAPPPAASAMDNMMDVDKALEATFEGAPPHPDGPAGVEPAGNAVQPEETPNTRELISRAGKIFLGGLGEPVASGDGRAVQETTNSLLIDVVDAMRELFTTSKKEIAASCRRRCCPRRCPRRPHCRLRPPPPNPDAANVALAAVPPLTAPAAPAARSQQQQCLQRPLVGPRWS